MLSGMKIATWNVNSIKVRTTHVTRWVERNAPDVLLLQELKGENFPTEEFKALGYESVFAGQKAYNGVAILSKHPITPILDRLPGDDSDEQARYLEVEINSVRIVNIYLPNGNPAPGDKFTYKLAWMDRLHTRLSDLRTKEIPFLIGGDFNVIPEARDCYDPKAWINDALYRLETREKFRALLNTGLYDAFRVFNQQSGQYTFWDYQGGCWPAGKGIRIDHFLLSPPLADRLKSCIIDSGPRGEDNPSDHTPVYIELS